MGFRGWGKREIFGNFGPRKRDLGIQEKKKKKKKRDLGEGRPLPSGPF